MLILILLLKLFVAGFFALGCVAVACVLLGSRRSRTYTDDEVAERGRMAG